jgi:two-component system, cell cycle response regulator
VLILLAEDDEVSRAVAEAMLTKWSHEVLLAEDGAVASRMVQSGIDFDVAILDWMMPGKAGVDVCRDLRRQPREPRPYVMMLTAKGSSENIVTGLDAGADDYLLKPFDPAELAARLRVAQRQMELQQSLISAREQVRFVSSHDPLSSQLNRGAILDALARALGDDRGAVRGKVPLSVLAVDLDGFTAINQRHGQAAGDEVLREVAGRIRSDLPPDAQIGRIGPDEFLCILPGAGPSRGEAAAEEVRRALSDMPVMFEWGAVPVSASVALATVGDNADLGSLLTALEAAVFQARSEGGDRVASVAMLS